MEYDDERTEFHAGQLIVLTSGEYSAYGVVGVFTVQKDFDVKDFRPNNWGTEGYYGLDVEYRRLVDDGYLEKVECHELWAGEEEI